MKEVNKMELENLDEYGMCEISVSAKCPDCNCKMITNKEQSAWTESDNLIVIPTICEKCKFTGVILCKIQ